MKISKKTATKLEKAGIEIADAPEGSDFQYRAFWAKAMGDDEDEGEGDDDAGEGSSIEFFWDDTTVLADAILFAKMMVLEHPGMTFEQAIGVKGEAHSGSVTIAYGKHTLGTVEDLKDLAIATNEAFDLLTDEERAAAIAADEAEEAEEEETRGSCVPEVYKNRYREQGTPGTCGDWLAVQLIDRTTGKDGKLDVDAMDELARLNGVDTGKWNRITNGWQGRLRMTARNAMVKHVAKAGFLVIPAGDNGDHVDAPAEWIAKNAPKIKETKGIKQAHSGATP